MNTKMMAVVVTGLLAAGATGMSWGAPPASASSTTPIPTTMPTECGDAYGLSVAWVALGTNKKEIDPVLHAVGPKTPVLRNLENGTRFGVCAYVLDYKLRNGLPLLSRPITSLFHSRPVLHSSADIGYIDPDHDGVIQAYGISVNNNPMTFHPWPTSAGRAYYAKVQLAHREATDKADEELARKERGYCMDASRVASADAAIGGLLGVPGGALSAQFVAPRGNDECVYSVDLPRGPSIFAVKFQNGYAIAQELSGVGYAPPQFAPTPSMVSPLTPLPACAYDNGCG